jgi:hypothetical protein
MSYALDITSEAADRLNALIESLPTDWHADVTAVVEAALQKLAGNPLPKAKDYYGHPAYEFPVHPGSRKGDWGVTYRISEDEKRLTITDAYKVPPPVPPIL